MLIQCVLIEPASTYLHPVWCWSSACYHRAIISYFNLPQPSDVGSMCVPMKLSSTQCDIDPVCVLVEPNSNCLSPAWCWFNTWCHSPSPLLSFLRPLWSWSGSSYAVAWCSVLCVWSSSQRCGETFHPALQLYQGEGFSLVFSSIFIYFVFTWSNICVIPQPSVLLPHILSSTQCLVTPHIQNYSLSSTQYLVTPHT